MAGEVQAANAPPSSLHWVGSLAREGEAGRGRVGRVAGLVAGDRGRSVGWCRSSRCRSPWLGVAGCIGGFDGERVLPVGEAAVTLRRGAGGECAGVELALRGLAGGERERRRFRVTRVARLSSCDDDGRRDRVDRPGVRVLVGVADGIGRLDGERMRPLGEIDKGNRRAAGGERDAVELAFRRRLARREREARRRRVAQLGGLLGDRERRRSWRRLASCSCPGRYCLLGRWPGR